MQHEALTSARSMLCNKEVKKRLVPIKTNVTAPASAAAVAYSLGLGLGLGQAKVKELCSASTSKKTPTPMAGYLTERVHVQVLHIDPGLR